MNETTASSFEVKMDPQRIFTNIKTLALNPKTAWSELNQAYQNTQDLIVNFFVPVLVTQGILSIIRYSVIGVSNPFTDTVYRTPIFTSVVQELLNVIFSLLGTYVFAMVLTKVADFFGAKTDDFSSLKLLTFSSSVGLFGFISLFIPYVGILGAIASVIYVLLSYTQLSFKINNIFKLCFNFV